MNTEEFIFAVIIIFITVFFTAFVITMSDKRALSNCIKSQEWCEIESPIFNTIIYGDENDRDN